MDDKLDRLIGDAAAAHHAGDLNGAERRYVEILGLGAPPSATARAHHGLAQIAIGAGHTALALAHLRRALEANPDDVATWMLYGATLSNNGRVQDAVTALEYAKMLSSTLDTKDAELVLHRRAGMIADFSAEIADMLPSFAPGSAGAAPARAEFALSSANTVVGLLSQLSGRTHPISDGIEPIKGLGADAGSTAAKARLAELLNQHGSDKANIKKHNYHEIYGYILREPHEISAVLEIGLGTNNVDVVSNMSKFGRPGASLRAFRDFLPNARIYGADVDERILFTEDRIETFFVDQTDQTSFDELARALPDGFDLIIDDGLHAPEANLNTLMFGLKKVKPGGWVVVEDIIPAALPVWQVAARLLPSEFEPHILKATSAYVFAVRRLGT